MDGDLYDEFGNYIGPELESDESEEEEGEREYEGGGDLVRRERGHFQWKTTDLVYSSFI